MYAGKKRFPRRFSPITHNKKSSMELKKVEFHLPLKKSYTNFLFTRLNEKSSSSASVSSSETRKRWKIERKNNFHESSRVDWKDCGTGIWFIILMVAYRKISSTASRVQEESCNFLCNYLRFFSLQSVESDSSVHSQWNPISIPTLAWQIENTVLDYRHGILQRVGVKNNSSQLCNLKCH